MAEEICPDDVDIEGLVKLEDIPAEKEILKTSVTKCDICGVGDVVKHGNGTDILIYGRHGIRKSKHEEYRCNFRNQNASCRAGYYHGYRTHQGLRIYEDDALKEKVLIVSTQSAFDIEYIIELVSDVELFAAEFETRAKKFN